MPGAPLGAALCDRLLFGHEPHRGGTLCDMRDVITDAPSGAAAATAAANSKSALVLYTRRWLMLMLFCLLSCVNGAMWIQFASVANICQSYFGTSALAVDWLSMIYMALYIPGDSPAPTCSLLQLWWLRVCMPCIRFRDISSNSAVRAPWPPRRAAGRRGAQRTWCSIALAGRGLALLPHSLRRAERLQCSTVLYPRRPTDASGGLVWAARTCTRHVNRRSQQSARRGAGPAVVRGRDAWQRPAGTTWQHSACLRGDFWALTCWVPGGSPNPTQSQPASHCVRVTVVSGRD